VHTLATDDVFHISWGQSLTSRALNAKDGKNITSLNFIYLLHVISMQFDHSADFEFLADFLIPQELSFFKFSLIDSNISELSEFTFL
jgi:hypothetical protein